MGLSPWHQTGDLSFEKDPKTQTSGDRGTRKQQEVSAWTKYLLTWSVFSPKQMPVSLCSESNDKVTNLLKFTGLLKVQARGCTPCQETHISLWWSWNPTLLLSLTQVFAAVAQSPSVPWAISMIRRNINENFRLWPHAGCEVQLQTHRPTTEHLDRVAT